MLVQYVAKMQIDERGAKFINAWNTSTQDSDLYPLISQLKSKLTISIIFLRFLHSCSHLPCSHDNPFSMH